MFDLQKAGGIAALFEAFAYIVGFAVMATLLNPGTTEGWSSTEKLAFVLGVLGYLGIAVGLTGVLTVVPMLKDLAMVFGISLILWFAWIGIVMLGRVR